MSDEHSFMLYIHPTFSIIGYMLVFASIASIIFDRKKEAESPRFSTLKILYLMWLFNFAGLVTGMIWAQIAWNSYWNWDPKETVTLLLFICVSSATLLYEKNRQITLLLLIVASILIFVNIFISFSNFSIHGYAIQISRPLTAIPLFPSPHSSMFFQIYFPS